VIVVNNITEHLKKHINSIVETGHIHSCYILAGNNNDTKADLIKYLAKALNCSSTVGVEHSSLDNKSIHGIEPCNTCRVCTLIDKDKYYGIYTLANEEKENSIKIERIRQLRDDMKSGNYNGYFICVIKNAQLLTTEAGNSLLKILEETPERIIFIFETINAYRMLPTIRSRAQIINTGHTKVRLGEYLFDDFKFTDISNLSKTGLSELIRLTDSLKIERVTIKENMLEYVNYLFSEYLNTQKTVYLDLIKIVNKYMKYLERPVNISNNLFLMLLEIKGRLAYV